MPRSRAAPIADDINAVENLLLCGRCHPIVDRNPQTFPVEVLAKYKADHEARVTGSVANRSGGSVVD